MYFGFKLFFSYEIIYQFGGIYLDTDSKSIKPFGVSFQHSFVCYDGGWNTLGKPLKNVFENRQKLKMQRTMKS